MFGHKIPKFKTLKVVHFFHSKSLTKIKKQLQFVFILYSLTQLRFPNIIVHFWKKKLLFSNFTIFMASSEWIKVDAIPRVMRTCTLVSLSHTHTRFSLITKESSRMDQGQCNFVLQFWEHAELFRWIDVSSIKCKWFHDISRIVIATKL